MDPGDPRMVGAVLLVTVHAKRVMRASTGPQIVSLVINHRHIYIEKGREGRGGASSIGIILPLVACPLASTLGASTLLWPGCLRSCDPAGCRPTAAWESKKKKWEAKLFNLSCPHAEGPQQKQEVALCVFEFP